MPYHFRPWYLPLLPFAVACAQAPPEVTVGGLTCPAHTSSPALSPQPIAPPEPGTYFLILVATKGPKAGAYDSGPLTLTSTGDGWYRGSTSVSPELVGGSAEISPSRSDGVDAAFDRDSMFVILLGTSGGTDGAGTRLDVLDATPDRLAGTWTDFRSAQQRGYFCAFQQ